MKRMILVILTLALVSALTACSFGDSPEKAAEEWLQALANKDGLKLDDRTCSTMKPQLQQGALLLTVFSIFGQQMTGQTAKTEVSDLTVTTTQSSGDTAQVRVQGEIRAAIGLTVQSQKVDETWQIVKEDGKWKWCGLAGQGTLPPTQADTPPISAPTSGSSSYSDLSATMPIDGPAKFTFSFPGGASFFQVDASTVPDMSGDVYLSFATGTGSPLVELNPKKWGKYACGRTLYWHVISDTGVQSSIQSTNVACTEVQATAERANLDATFSNLSATLPMNGPAQFNFTFAGSSSDFRIDISTVADMHIDVYLSFAVGTTSPLIEPNPSKWDKVSCGRTLYWRVVTNRGAQSPIQTIIVTC